MTKALDGYHGNDIDNSAAQGFPDSERASSFARTIRHRMTVPASSVATDTSVFFTQNMSEMDMGMSTMTRNVFDPASTAGVGDAVTGRAFATNGGAATKLGLINVVQVPAGTPFLPVAAAEYTTTGFTYPASANIQNFNLDDYLAEPSRVVSMSIKALNDSSVTELAGTMTGWRKDVCSELVTISDRGDLANTGRRSQSSLMYSMPPRTASEIHQLRDRKTFSSHEGLMMNAIFSEAPQVAQPRYGGVLWKHNTTPNAACEVLYNVNTGVAAGLLPTNNYPALATHNTPIQHGGILVENQPIGATMAIEIVVVLECFPPPGSANVSLCNPAPEADMFVFALYKKITARLPVACPASHNPTSRWWNAVCNVGMLVAPAFPELSPLILAASKTVGLGGDAISKAMTRRSTGAGSAVYTKTSPQTALILHSKTPGSLNGKGQAKPPATTTASGSSAPARKPPTNNGNNHGGGNVVRLPPGSRPGRVQAESDQHPMTAWEAWSRALANRKKKKPGQKGRGSGR